MIEVLLLFLDKSLATLHPRLTSTHLRDLFHHQFQLPNPSQFHRLCQTTQAVRDSRLIGMLV